MSPYHGDSAVVVGVVPSHITARHFIVLPEDKFRIGSPDPLNNAVAFDFLLISLAESRS